MATRGPRLKLYIDETDAPYADLDAMGERSIDARPVMKVLQGLMLKAARAQFDTEGERGGLPWEKDSPKWLARKLAEGGLSETEQYSGSLLKSLTDESKSAVKKSKGKGRRSYEGGAIRRVGKTSTTFGTKLFYAEFQGHKRQLLNLTLQDSNDYASRMVDWILEGKT